MTSRNLRLLFSIVTIGLSFILTPHAAFSEGNALHESDFPSAELCRDCHPKQYWEWSASSHAYSQMSPFMMALGGYFYSKYSETTGSYCIRCHDPVGTALGFNMQDLLTNKERPLVSREGVTCIACHRVNKKFGRVNGEYSIVPGPLSSTMYGPSEKIEQKSISNNKIPPHETSQFKGISGSEMCVICHEVYTTDGFRFDETYSEWRNSPAANEGVVCQDCHMGLVQGANKGYETGYTANVAGIDLKKRKVSDHTMVGPDYSIYPLSEFPIKRELWPDWTKEKDFGLWLESTREKMEKNIPVSETDKERWRIYQSMMKESKNMLATVAEKRAQLLRNSAAIRTVAPKSLKRGEKSEIAVSVRSIFNGHKFPAGLAFERQIWLEVRLMDSKGNTLFVSGDLDKNMDLRDNLSKSVRKENGEIDEHLFNLQGKFYNRTMSGTETLTVLPVNEDLDTLPFFRPGTELSAAVGHPFIARFQNNGLPPLAERSVEYPITIPPSSATGNYTLSVKLQFRNFPPYLLDFLGAAQMIPVLTIFTIDEETITIPVN